MARDGLNLRSVSPPPKGHVEQAAQAAKVRVAGTDILRRNEICARTTLPKMQQVYVAAGLGWDDAEEGHFDFHVYLKSIMSEWPLTSR